MSRPLRLLLVEDSESDAELVVRFLNKTGYAVYHERVEEARQMEAALEKQTWDVIIADYRLPRFDAPSALAILDKTGLDIPFIVVSGAIGEKVAVDMMRSGAHDYLMKGNLARLGPAVEREINEAKTRLKRRVAEEALRESEGRLALAIQAARLGAFDFYPQNGEIICSDRFKSHLGLSPEADVSYQAMFKALDSRDRQSINNLLRPDRAGPCSAEFRVVGIEDGIERWLSMQGSVYFDKQGRAVRFVGVTLDITERRMIEQRLCETVDELQSALTEKTVLLKEVHHRVKNNLAVISSLLAMKAEATSNSEAKVALEQSQRRVQSIALIHEHIYGNDQLDRINFAQYAEELAHELYHTFIKDPNQISMNIQADPLELDVQHAIPCGLIVNELVSNSFKYAFPEGRRGNVGIECHELAPNKVKLVVYDDGIGMPKELDWRKAGSLGLEIVQILAKQIDARIEVMRDSGTRFELTFEHGEKIPAAETEKTRVFRAGG